MQIANRETSYLVQSRRIKIKRISFKTEKNGGGSLEIFERANKDYKFYSFYSYCNPCLHSLQIITQLTVRRTQQTNSNGLTEK